jgi:tripartite-type tricarboxylate transporter receptor subunit TctC
MSAIRRSQYFTALLATLVLGTASGLPAQAQAQAQTYPTKPIHIVVPYSPGGITDVIARALGQRLTEAWKQQVVVENRPTGAGIVGVDAVAKSAPDGHTLLVAADAALVTAPHTYAKLPYDALNDFAPVTGLGFSPHALIVHPSVPARTVRELIELGKKKPASSTTGRSGSAPAAT